MPRLWPASSIARVPAAPSARLPFTVVNPGLAPMLSVPLLVKVPVPRLILPPLRNWPLLVKDRLLRVKLAPAATSIVPAFAAKPAVVDSVPVWTRRVPVLTKLVGWICVDPVSSMLPRFTTLAALLS